MPALVSIVVPCFNQAQYLSEALESVLNQTYQHWECIIVNDGSPDNTKEIAEVWLKKDPRFKYIEQENKGLSGARNAGISKAKGEYILPLDADDKISEDYLELAVKEFQVPDPPKVVYCRAEFFGQETGEWALKPFSLKDLAIGNMIFCSAFFKKADWEKVGGYDEKMKFGWEDWEFWINLLKNGGKTKKIDRFCFFYRMKNRSMGMDLTEKQIKEIRNYVYKKHVDFYLGTFGSFWEFREKVQSLERLISSEKHAINLISRKLLGKTFFKDIPE